MIAMGSPISNSRVFIRLLTRNNRGTLQSCVFQLRVIIIIIVAHSSINHVQFLKWRGNRDTGKSIAAVVSQSLLVPPIIDNQTQENAKFYVLHSYLMKYRRHNVRDNL